MAVGPLPVVVTSTDELIELEGMTVTEEDPLRVTLVIVRVPGAMGVAGEPVGIVPIA